MQNIDVTAEIIAARQGYDSLLANLQNKDLQLANIIQYTLLAKYKLSADGITDDSDKFQLAVNQNNVIMLPENKSIYFSKPVKLNSNTIIIGGENSKIIVNGTAAFNCSGAVDSSSGSPVVQFKENIRIQGVKFKNLSTSTCPYAIGFNSVNNIKITDCKTENMGLFGLWTALTITSSLTQDANALSGITENNLSKNFIIKNNIVKGTNGVNDASGIAVAYCKNGIINDNICDTLKNGIQYWSGDSNSYNAYFNNDTPLWVKNVSISGNKISNITEGGIWGSRGQNIQIIGNKLEAIGDVGVDFEGSKDCIADTNLIKNANNGALSVFFGSTNIKFNNNTCIVDDSISKYWLNYIQNYANKTYMSVEYTNNKYLLNTTDPSKIGYVNIGVGEDDRNSNSLIIFKDNTLRNCVITSSYVNNCVKQIVTGNNIILKDRNFTTSLSAIDVGSHNMTINGECASTVKNNTIYLKNCTTPNLIGIFSYEWGGDTIINHISDNTIQGCSISLQVQGGTNSPSKWLIERNKFDGIFKDLTATGHSLVQLDKNKTLTGGNYPNAIPTSQTKDGSNNPIGQSIVGQKIYFDTPDANGYTSAFCTVTGNPGTWKRIGKIEA